MTEMPKLVSDVFKIPMSRAIEIANDVKYTLYEDPIVVDEQIFIDRLIQKYKGGEREFALYIGARESEGMVMRKRGFLERLFGS